MLRPLIPAILISALASCGARSGEAQRPIADFTLSSSAFADGQTIPAEFTCEGADRTPPLRWSDPPAGTKSFALLVDDPDAPSGMFRHWGVYDIPASARALGSDVAQAINDFGKPGYGAPCPPKGDGPHHYRFKLLALDAGSLALSNPKIAELEAEARKHLVGSAQLTGIYERK